MRVTKKENKRADAILAADMHLRLDQPLCRLDNYQEAQKGKLIGLSALRGKHGNILKEDCPILVAGDVFHTWKPTTLSEGFEAATLALKYLPSFVYAIPGQHDLPYHDINSFEKSPLAVLQNSTKVTVFSGFVVKGFDKFIGCFIPWHIRDVDESLIKNYNKLMFNLADKISLKRRKIAVIHKLIMNPGSTDKNIKYEGTPEQILDQLKDFDLVVSGDNHIPFTYKNSRGQLLVNPGSMMRMRADQIDHKPRVYLWYADENIVEPAYFPIEQGVISRRHIKEEEKTDSFIKCLDGKNELEMSLSFEDNIKNRIKRDKIDKKIVNKIYKAMEGK